MFVAYLPLVFLCLIQFAAMTDNAALSNALAAIALDLKATVAQIQFANIVYPLIAGSTMIASGLLGIKYGWKKMLLIGVAIITIGEVSAWLAPNIYVLIFFSRVLAGIGASLAIPAVLGIIMQTYSGNKLAISFGVLAAVTAIGSALAPIISGFIIVHYSWRVSFLLVALLFIAGFVGALFSIKSPKNSKSQRVTFDLMGFVFLTLGLTASIFGISHIPSWGLVDPSNAPFTILGLSPIPFIIAIGVMLLGVFSAYEDKLEKTKGKDYVLIPRIFLDDPAIKGGILMSSFVFYNIGGLTFTLILYMQVVLSNSAIMSGIYISVFSLGMSITSILTPILGKDKTPKNLCRLGIVVSCLATFLMSLSLNPSNITNLFLFNLFLMGGGIGIVASQSNLAVSSAISDSKLAAKSSGIQGAARNIGESIGVALMGIIIMLGLTASVKNHLNDYVAIPNSIKSEISIMHSIPFISNPALEKVIKSRDIPEDVGKALLELNEIGRMHAMRVTLMFMAIFGFLFFFVTKGIINKPIRELH